MKYLYKSRIIQQKMTIFASVFNIGVLAQLARALDWQSKGQGFDSLTLHNSDVIN
jgi:hypothetical protein